jgi:hypothetical protein
VTARGRATISSSPRHNDLQMIGKRLGPFDGTLIEAGQYDTEWLAVQALPACSRQSHDSRALGLLRLANHGWTEPVERVLATGRCHGVDVLTPHPGESLEPTQQALIARWWPMEAWQSAEKNPIVTTERGLPSDRIRVEPCSKRDDEAGVTPK